MGDLNERTVGKEGVGEREECERRSFLPDGAYSVQRLSSGRQLSLLGKKE